VRIEEENYEDKIQERQKDLKEEVATVRNID